MSKVYYINAPDNLVTRGDRVRVYGSRGQGRLGRVREAMPSEFKVVVCLDGDDYAKSFHHGDVERVTQGEEL